MLIKSKADFPFICGDGSSVYLCGLLESCRFASILKDILLKHVQVATIAWFEADSVCGSHSVAIPLVLVLPYLFRFFQCLRQYKDTGEKTTLLNGKILACSTLSYYCLDYILLLPQYLHAVGTLFPYGFDCCCLNIFMS